MEKEEEVFSFYFSDPVQGPLENDRGSHLLAEIHIEPTSEAMPRRKMRHRGKAGGSVSRTFEHHGYCRHIFIECEDFGDYSMRMRIE